ncbi:hypothetical protein F5Y16DRAFT_237452 [Xylariaceae sp. FL0255]|nr:hypothetical protein F5Y16DRAFT_237452 [Xylariaceae sp. FL0255]
MSSISYANPPGLIVGSVFLEVLAGGSVALRFLTRKWKEQPVIASDWLALVGFVFGTGLFIVEVYAIAAHLLGYTIGGTLEEEATVSERLNHAKYVEFSFLLFGTLGVGFVKLSTCFLYLHLFGKLRFRPFLIFWTIIITLWTLTFFIFLFAECGLHYEALYQATAEYDKYCKSAIPSGWIQAGTDVGTDLVTLLIPIPVVLGLRMSKGLKVLTLLIFAIGGLTVVASTVKAYIYINATLDRYTEDALITLTAVSIWNLAEVQIGIIATSGPVIRYGIAKLLPSSASLRSWMDSLRWHSKQSSSPSSNFPQMTSSEEGLRRAGSKGQSEDGEDSRTDKAYPYQMNVIRQPPI